MGTHVLIEARYPASWQMQLASGGDSEHPAAIIFVNRHSLEHAGRSGIWAKAVVRVSAMVMARSFLGECMLVRVVASRCVGRFLWVNSPGSVTTLYTYPECLYGSIPELVEEVHRLRQPLQLRGRRRDSRSTYDT